MPLIDNNSKKLLILCIYIRPRPYCLDIKSLQREFQEDKQPSNKAKGKNFLTDENRPFVKGCVIFKNPLKKGTLYIK